MPGRRKGRRRELNTISHSVSKQSALERGDCPHTAYSEGSGHYELLFTVVVYEFPSDRAALGSKYGNYSEVAKGVRVLQSRKEDLLWQICCVPGKPPKSKV